MFNWHSKKKRTTGREREKNTREKERQREKENQHISNALRTRPPGCVRSIDYSLDSKNKCMFSLFLIWRMGVSFPKFQTQFHFPSFTHNFIAQVFFYSRGVVIKANVSRQDTKLYIHIDTLHIRYTHKCVYIYTYIIHTHTHIPQEEGGGLHIDIYTHTLYIHTYIYIHACIYICMF